MFNNETAKFINDIGRRIAEIRNQKGWRQQDLADAISVTWRQVARWEAGDSNFTVSTLLKLSQILNCSPNDFFKKPRSVKPSRGRPRLEKGKIKSNNIKIKKLFG